MMDPIAIPTLNIPLYMDIEIADASMGDVRMASLWNDTLNAVAKNPQNIQAIIIVIAEYADTFRSMRHTDTPNIEPIRNS